MGQQITVVATPSRRPGVLRFEANCNLTGMGHETFHSGADVVGAKPSAALARNLLATGQVDAVHVFGNIVTVDLRKGFDGSGLDVVVRDLYQYWKPGMEPPTFDDVVAADAPAVAAAVTEGGGGDSVYLQRVPPHLVERSRAALEKWRATH
ncbi:MAG: hypothetical protein ACO3C1_12605 [Ilumatobacteraceae bacterium]